MRYATMRGLKKVRMQVTLTFACMNLKKLALWKKKTGKLPEKASRLLQNFCEIFKKMYFRHDAFIFDCECTIACG